MKFLKPLLLRFGLLEFFVYAVWLKNGEIKKKLYLTVKRTSLINLSKFLINPGWCVATIIKENS